jgi:hypothetical protein
MKKTTAAAWIAFCPAELQRPPIVSKKQKILYVHASSAGPLAVSSEFSGAAHRSSLPSSRYFFSESSETTDLSIAASASPLRILRNKQQLLSG